MTSLGASIPCPICGATLTLSLCRPSKAGKNSLHIRCLADGRHLRGFIAHQPLVDQVLDQLRRIVAGETKPPQELPPSDHTELPVPGSDVD